MRICLAQTKSVAGAIQKNIELHLDFIQRAIKLKSDLIVFPELSITNYEPGLAKKLATTVADPMFQPFQELANKNNLTIAIGMPYKDPHGTRIGLFIFTPSKESTVYSKQILHEDELPYFVAGNKSIVLPIKGIKIVFGICYETLQKEHFAKSMKLGADLYIASVAKPQGGIKKAYEHYPKMAREFKIPVLMVNSVGPSDNFISMGQSAAWKANGELLGNLDLENPGLLLYDSQSDTIEKEQLKIEKAVLSEVDEIFKIYVTAKKSLKEKAIYQWTENYPNQAIIEQDVRNSELYVLKNGRDIIGAIQLSETQEPEYKSISWAIPDAKVLVIHRMVIAPECQGKGYAKVLMSFAEDVAKQNQFAFIRLDAYSLNKNVLSLYKARNFVIRGTIYFPQRTHPFYAMEKQIVV